MPTKADLMKKLASKNKEIKELKEMHKKETDRLKKENATLLKNKTLLSDDEKYKEVIYLYAFGHNSGNIYQILSDEKGQDITIHEINAIIDKIDYLEPEMHKYYMNARKEFKEKVKLDQGFFASAIYKKYNLLEQEASTSLVLAKELGDEQHKMKCIDRLISIYDKMGKAFSKDGVADMGGQTLEELMSGYEEKSKQSDKIIKFNPSKVEMV